MKKYLIKIALFFVAVAMVDILFGIACQYMNDHSKGGGIKNRYYVCKESNEDVLVFGSSRAKYHYVPDIIEDSLNMTCYNTGEEGCGIILCYGLLKMITKRYSPKLIIYDVTGFDMYKDDNMKYVDLMKPYYYETGIDSIFWAVNPNTRYLMLSNLYRYNTTCLRVLGNYIHPMTNYPKGYCASYKIMEYEPEEKEVVQRVVDTLKIYYLEVFIKLAKKSDVVLVFSVSPSYKASSDDSYYNPAKQLCEKYSIPFLYYAANPDISSDKMCFGDKIHLNHTGATKFTSDIISLIKEKYVLVIKN